jgi:hypothetical protein
VVILELIRAPMLSLAGQCICWSKTRRLRPFLLTQNNLADRMGLSRRRTVRVSALSTFDGSVRDYHGCDG